MKFPAYSDDAYWTNYVIFNPDDSPAAEHREHRERTQRTVLCVNRIFLQFQN